jgi:hypothetical protein
MPAKFIPSVTSEALRDQEIPWLPGVAGIVHRSDLDAVEVRNPVTGVVRPLPGVLTAVQTLRSRQTIAAVNAGATVLAAIPGYKYRLVDAAIITIGGAAGAVDTVDILGTQAAAGVKLVAFAQASLLQSVVLRAGESGAAVLADGASFAANDANTAITVGKTGATITTATHFDFILSYVLEAA